MKKNNIRKILLLCLLLIVSITIVLVVTKKEDYIDKVLSTKEYSYLPREAQNYIKDIYNKTGNLILTEKNKKQDLPYLNPKFINYLTLTPKQQENTDLIPNPKTIKIEELKQGKPLIKFMNKTSFPLYVYQPFSFTSKSHQQNPAPTQSPVFNSSLA